MDMSAIFTLIPPAKTGNAEADNAAEVVYEFYQLLITGKLVEATGKCLTDDCIVVEPSGMPWTRSVYEGLPGFVGFLGEVGAIAQWGKPTMRFFGVAPDLVISKIFDAESKVGEEKATIVSDILEEAWFKDGKIYKWKPYYWNQLPLMKDQIKSKGTGYLAFKEEEETSKKEQMEKHGVLTTA